jgi:predicted transcriptional regulator
MGIKIDETTQQRIKALGLKRDRSSHWLMKTAIEKYLNIEEQFETEKTEDMERWEQYQLTGEYIEGPKVDKWLSDLSIGKNYPCPK